MRLAAALMVALGLAAASAAAAPARIDPALYKALHWRSIGPYRGGRALAVAGVPGQPDVFFFGAAAGGLWKSIDAGGHWKSLFAAPPTGSIGAIAIAPSDARVIWVGTGEGALRGDITFGGGVWRSADGGTTWADAGLHDSRQIGAVIVDPRDPDLALVAAIGHAFGPNAERGVFRTTDGGRTWTRTLGGDPRTGAIDVAFDPHDARIVYAALWQVVRKPWTLESGGPGSGLYRSTDEGLTWTKLEGHGLPAPPLGRIDVSVSGADARRIYAMIEAKDGGLFRSDDGGAHWTLVSQDGRIRQRAWYFSKIYADPKAVDTVYALNTGLLKSTDGGKTFNLVAATHGDHHGLWIDPNDPRRLINGNDGGASVSLDGGITWSTQGNQPTGAFYHVAADERWPYWLYGAQQDNSNLAVATYADAGVIGPRDWYPAGGGESGFVVPDPRDAMIIYSDQENGVQRFDKRSEQGQDISPYPGNFSGHPASELTHRYNWTSPLMLSPNDPDALYFGGEVIWKSVDHGMSWKIISPDLTRDDKSKQQPSGGPITKDITSVEYYDTIFALAESPRRKGMLWAGSDDGLVHLSLDDGGHWADVTPKAVPAWSTISMIEASPHDAERAYLAVDRHKLDDVAPYAFRTADAGRTWTAITAGLPSGAVVHAVREDPQRPGLLFAATELGVFVSFDDGGAWRSLQLDLPPTPVHDLVVKGDDLAAATHGRGFWILTDITPLRQLARGEVGPAPILFAPEKAVRLYYPDQVDKRRPVGENPPAGALIDYALGAAPAGEVTLVISDTQGRPIRHLSSARTAKVEQPPEWPNQIIAPDTLPAEGGMNRFVWDLRMDDPVQIPDAVYEDQAPRGPIVAPGVYRLTLTANGVARTAELTVVADPRAGANLAAIGAKTELSIAVWRDIDALHRAVNAIRAARARLPATPAAAALKARLTAIEEALMQVEMKGSEADLAFPGKLNEQLATFALSLEDADTAPTAQHLATFAAMHAALEAQLARWAALQPALAAPAA